MARISVVDSPFVSLLLWDLDKKQQLREHTINPPGQERYIKPIDSDGALTAYLETLGASDVAGELQTVLIDLTVGADDLTLATVKTQMDAMTGITGSTDDEGNAVRDLLSVSLVETGNFMLSFDGGVISKAVAEGWIKVFVEDGSALYSL